MKCRSFIFKRQKMYSSIVINYYKLFMYIYLYVVISNYKTLFFIFAIYISCILSHFIYKNTILNYKWIFFINQTTGLTITYIVQRQYWPDWITNSPQHKWRGRKLVQWPSGGASRKCWELYSRRLNGFIGS